MNIRSHIFHGIGLWLALFTLWLMLSGHYTPMLLTIGFVFTIIIVLIAIRLDIVDHEALPLHLSWRYFLDLAWLGGEIFKSNMEVARIVLRPTLKISPRMIRTRSLQSSDVGKVIYANSITLTPGTVSVEFEDDDIIVHAISQEAADGVLNDEMNRRVAAIERR